MEWLYVIVALAGASTLAFATTWIRYLGFIVGDTGPATAGLAALLIGGLAAGAALAGRLLPRLVHPLLAFAIANGLLALAAFGFHDIFVSVRAALEGDGGSGMGARWFVAASLVLPPAALAGAALPLLGAVVLRDCTRHGEAIAWLHCAALLGGASGVLAVTLYLFDQVGLPGAMYASGLVCAALGLTAWVMHHRFVPPPPLPHPPPTLQPAVPAWTAVLTGLVALVCTVTWMRMLTLVVGPQARAGELMVAALVTGLAYGAYLVRERLDQGDRPYLLARLLLATGVLVTATAVAYGLLFYAPGILRPQIPSTAQAYLAYGLSQYSVAFVFMVAPATCIGMALPTLMRTALAAHGEAAIGLGHASVLLGAVAGVVLVTLLLPPVPSVPALSTAALVFLLAGVELLYRFRRQRLLAGCMLLVATIVVGVVTPPIHPYLLTSAPYRTSLPLDWRDQAGTVPFTHTGPTAHVALVEHDDRRLLHVDGRIAGAARTDGVPSRDAEIGGISAALALLHHPAARRATVLGHGGGHATAMLLGSAELAEVTTVARSQAIFDVGSLLAPAAAAASGADPRAQVAIGASKVHLTRPGHGANDIIVAQPPPLWVAGVPGLFALEHFAALHAALAADGVLVQLLSLQDSEPRTLAAALEAVAATFPDYVLYLVAGTIVIVTSPDAARLAAPDAAAFTRLPGLADRLAAHEVAGPADLAALAIGDRERFHPYVASFRTPAHSDYFPVLDEVAGRAFFLQTRYALPDATWRHRYAFTNDVLPGRALREPFAPVAASSSSLTRDLIHAAQLLLDTERDTAAAVRAALTHRGGGTLSPQLAAQLDVLLDPDCVAADELNLVRVTTLVEVLTLASTHLLAGEFAAAWRRLEADVPCVGVLAADELSGPLVGFFRAVALGDHAATIAHGSVLLPPVQPINGPTQFLVLLRMMLAAVATEQGPLAVELSYRLPRQAPAASRHALRLVGAHAIDQTEGGH